MQNADLQKKQKSLLVFVKLKIKPLSISVFGIGRIFPVRILRLRKLGIKIVK